MNVPEDLKINLTQYYSVHETSFWRWMAKNIFIIFYILGRTLGTIIYTRTSNKCRTHVNICLRVSAIEGCKRIGIKCSAVQSKVNRELRSIMSFETRWRGKTWFFFEILKNSKHRLRVILLACLREGIWVLHGTVGWFAISIPDPTLSRPLPFSVFEIFANLLVSTSLKQQIRAWLSAPARCLNLYIVLSQLP